ncbi:MAG: PAS domain S-box protein [Halarcobacter sp.]
MNKNNYYKQNIIAFYFFIFSIGLILSFILIDIIYLSKNNDDIILKNIQKETYEKETLLKNKFIESKNLLQTLNQSKYFQEYKTTNNTKLLEDLFLFIAKTNKDIMSIKYINKDGLEKVRVNRKKHSEEVFLVEKNKLQDKSNRYYFKESKKYPNNKIWFTNIDLDVENNTIKKPFSPTFRAILTIKDKEFKSIVVINYFMEDLLNTLMNSPLYDFILIDEDGYILKHYKQNKNWSFYKDSKLTIKSEFPNDYKQILSQNLLETNKFISIKINTPTQKKLILLIKTKNTFFNKEYEERINRYLVVSVLVLLLSFIISFLFSKQLKKIIFTLKNTQKENLNLDEKVKAKTKELEESKKQLTDILDNVSDFIWQTDENGKYTYVSPQIKDILGFDAKDILGKTPFDFMSEEEEKKIKAIFFDLKNKKLSIKNLENINIDINGKEVWIETNGNPILDSTGKLIGYRGTDRDITKRKEQEKEIRKINNKLKELNKTLESKVQKELEKNKLHEVQIFNQAKMAAMGDMLGNIAHQWRQPLSYISTTASGIKLNHEFNILNHEDLPHAMDEIVAKTQYLSQTIDTFRNFLMEKKEYQNIILQDRVEIALNIVSASLKDNHIYLEKVMDYTNPINTKLVVGELSEVIINIINNAKDILLSRQIPNPWIVVELTQAENTAILSIEDNAGGIEPEVISRVFEPYFTTKDLSVGTGLGLYMSYKIVKESLKGKLSVQNSEFGAKFIIEIPLIK